MAPIGGDMRVRMAMRKMGLAAILLAVQCVGQSGTQQITVNVPFSFVAAETRMAAGIYILMYNESQSILRIQSAQTGRAVFVVSRPVGTRTNIGAKLVFRRCGEKYFFIEAEFLGAEGKHVFAPRAETECSKNNLQPSEDVSVVARPRPR